ncbi:MAG: O-antigen ligase family protein [Fusobacterium sp.]|nr:O-antigen ligase family protein [Fusobacterium sp.]
MQNIDFLIFLALAGTLLASLTMSSGVIGLGALAVAGLTLVKFLTNPNAKIRLSAAEWCLIIYFLIVFISLCGSTLFGLSLKGFLKTVTYILFYFSVAPLFKSNFKYGIATLFVIAAGVFFESGIAFLQNFTHVQAIAGWQDVSNLNPEQVMTRVYGTLQPYNPNLFGGYLVVGLPACLGLTVWLLVKKYYKLAILFFAGTGAGVLSLVFTGCRGAYIAFFMMTLAVLAISLKFFWQNYKKIYIAVVGAGVALSTALILASTSLRARILSIFAMRQDSSNSFRFNVYQASWQMFKDNWLLGIGVGNKNFREIYGLYMKTGFDALSAYNIYLELAVESGIFALIAFLAYLGMQIFNAVKYILTSTDAGKIVLISAALVSLIGVMAHGMVDTVFFRPQIQIIFWVMMALIAARD